MLHSFQTCLKRKFLCSSGVVPWLPSIQGAVDMQTHRAQSHKHTQLQVSGVNGKLKQGNVWMSWVWTVQMRAALAKLTLLTILGSWRLLWLLCVHFHERLHWRNYILKAGKGRIYSFFSHKLGCVDRNKHILQLFYLSTVVTNRPTSDVTSKVWHLNFNWCQIVPH